ncbi:MAG: hypothetical protein NVS1B4_02520 [Gemmatimonadaceae bacterium]
MNATAPHRDLPPDALRFDSVAHTVRLHLVAAWDDANEHLNFNGGEHGSHTVEVPAGWRVAIHLTSADADLSHSALVIPFSQTIPAELPGPAFPGATSTSPAGGIDDAGEDDLTFVAAREGRYLIVCGVADHAVDGQWIGFVVSRTARVPSYR